RWSSSQRSSRPMGKPYCAPLATSLVRPLSPSTGDTLQRLVSPLKMSAYEMPKMLRPLRLCMSHSSRRNPPARFLRSCAAVPRCGGFRGGVGWSVGQETVMPLARVVLCDLDVVPLSIADDITIPVAVGVHRDNATVDHPHLMLVCRHLSLSLSRNSRDCSISRRGSLMCLCCCLKTRPVAYYWIGSHGCSHGMCGTRRQWHFRSTARCGRPFFKSQS